MVMILAVFSCIHAEAQWASITGRVIDGKTAEPLPFANVFLNNTTIGTVTGLAGEFKITNITSPAVYDIIISFVGYDTYRTKVSLDGKELTLGEVRLIPAEIELGTVEVKGTKDVVWERKLKNFERIFLGADKVARQCVIKNPWVIDFPQMEDKSTVAKASAPIEIENRALGYSINFHLTSFVANKTSFLIQGDAIFKELTTENKKEREAWERLREETYRHSVQHLFKSILEGRIFGEGFRIFKSKTTDFIDTVNLVTATTRPGVYRIAMKDPVDIWYGLSNYGSLSPEHYEITALKLRNGYVLVNSSGYEMNPTDVTLSGVMGEKRVAYMLPLNYRSDKDMIIDPTPAEDNSIYFLQEQVYVQTDRPYYYPGETVWLKGYIRYADFALRDSLSKVIHVEWIDSATGNVEFSKKYLITQGTFSGSIVLDQGATTGTHYLRAYTALNRNFGDEHLYCKPVPVLDLLYKVDPAQGYSVEIASDRLQLEFDQPNYQTRQKVNLLLTIRDEDGAPIGGDFSIAVTDATQVVPIGLGSTIRAQDSLRDLTAFGKKRKRNFPIEYGLNITGQFLNDAGKPESALLNVMRVRPNKLSVAQSDERGLFELPNLAFQDTAQYFIRGISKTGKPFGRVKILPDSVVPLTNLPSFTPLRYKESETPQRLFSSYEVPKDARMLENVTVRSTKVEQTDPFKPYGKGQYNLTRKDLEVGVRYGNLLLALQGRFPGLVVRQMYVPGEELRWVLYSQRAATSSINYVREVSVLLNGMLYLGEPAKLLQTLDPSTVESIEYKNGINVMLGAEGCCGTLSIRTRTGATFDQAIPDDPVELTTIRGYDTSPVFQAPDYGAASPQRTESDFRALIYWNPIVVPDEKTGKASVSFYTSDLKGPYRIEVEGVDGEGEPVRVVRYMTVRER